MDKKLADILKQAEAILKKRTVFMDEQFKVFMRKVPGMNDKLLNMILKDYVGRFNYKNNRLSFGQDNLRTVADLDNVFDKFKRLYSGSAYEQLGLNMLKLADYSENYFKKLGASQKALENTTKALDELSKRIGIAKDGSLLKGGYLDRLAGASPVRERLKDYVTKSIADGTSLQSYQQGFSDIIAGGEGINSQMTKYWETETHDTIFEVGRATDDVFSQATGMNFFLYMPGEIDTSRPFCKGGNDKVCGCTFESKIGKMFHREETKSWEKQDWEGKKPGNILHVLGGWNCRHEPYWITDELAEQIDPDKYAEYAETTAE